MRSSLVVLAILAIGAVAVPGLYPAAGDDPFPVGVYRLEGGGDPPLPTWYLSCRPAGMTPRLLLVLQGYSDKGEWAVEYHGAPVARAGHWQVAFSRVQAGGTVPAQRFVDGTMTLRRDGDGVRLAGAAAVRDLKPYHPYDRHVSGMFPGALTNEYVFVTKDNDAGRRYLRLGPDGRGGLAGATWSRRAPVPVPASLADWRITLDRAVMQDMGAEGAVDHVSTWVRVAPAGGAAFEFEVDYERSPVTWLAGRTWEHGKAVRWAHFEEIERRAAPGGWRLLGYRIDRTEEYRLLAPGAKDGPWYVLDEAKGRLVSHDGRSVFACKFEDDYKILVVTWPDGVTRRFKNDW